MKCSAGLPTCMEGMMYPTPFASVQEVVGIAKHAESCGFDSVWGNDHMSTQNYVRGQFSSPPRFWDLLTVLSFVAAKTNTVGLATGVLVPALRGEIAVVAKQLATLDHLSEGRLIVGLGVGGYREEFEALYPTARVHRGRQLEEFVQALRILHSKPDASYKGKYYEFDHLDMYPKPLQDPLPLYFGGNDLNASRRAALWGQGWMPAGMPAERLQTRIKKLREMVEEAGRDYKEIDVAPQYQVRIDSSYEKAVAKWRASQMYRHKMSLAGSTYKDHLDADHEKENLIGTAEIVCERANHLKELGVKHLCGLYFCAESVSELKEQMSWFAEQVMPQLA